MSTSTKTQPPTIRVADLSKVDAATREEILKLYAVQLRKPDTMLTMEEAAWLYGYQYSTVRWLVANGKLKSRGRREGRRVSHKQMRAYIASKKKEGRFRDTLKKAQSLIA